MFITVDAYNGYIYEGDNVLFVHKVLINKSEGLFYMVDDNIGTLDKVDIYNATNIYRYTEVGHIKKF